MQENNNINVLGLKDITVIKLEEDNDFVYVDACVYKMTACPHCGSTKIWVHDHRVHNIKDTHLHGKSVLFT